MAFVEFRDVSKMYQMGEVSVAAVRDMSFQIEQGEFVVIVGPSGAGKTTLLNMATVRSHVHAIYTKADVHSADELAALIREEARGDKERLLESPCP